MKVLVLLLILILSWSCDYQEEPKFIAQITDGLEDGGGDDAGDSTVGEGDIEGGLQDDLKSWYSMFVIEVTLNNESIVDTRVDYEKMISLYNSENQEFLNLRRSIIANFKFAEINTFSRDEQIAFWLNAYNFFMMNSILIYSTEKLIKGVWKVPGIGRGRIFKNKLTDFGNEAIIIGGREKVSLDDIEYKFLLEDIFKRKDARIHFALNCGALGCPALIPEPFNGESVQFQLNSAVQNGLKTFRNLHNSKNKTSVTKLFKWFKEDFQGETGKGNWKSAAKAFIKKYNPGFRVKSDIKTHGYNWCLNDYEPGQAQENYGPVKITGNLCFL